jgi:hypothetical protein
MRRTAIFYSGLTRPVGMRQTGWPIDYFVEIECSG